MKKYFLMLLGVVTISLITNCSSESGDTEGGGEKPEPKVVPIVDSEQIIVANEEGIALNKEGYKLIFSESFDQDLAQWTEWNGGAFNQEVQLYRSEQLEVEKGMLTIKTKRQSIKGNVNPWETTQKDFDYVSGRIESTTDFWPDNVAKDDEFIVSARIKLPTGNGMWPAFWLYEDPWPTLGELDILEARGNAGKQFQFNMFYGTVANKAIGQNSKRTYNAPIDLRQDFHNYELVWQKNKVQIALDGKVVITVDSSNNNLEDIFGNKLHIVLNNAVGGVFFGKDNRDPANYVDSAETKVDWVRVYQKTNELSVAEFK